MRDGFRDENNHTRERQVFEPPAWLSSDELEEELMAAILVSGGEKTSALAVIDKYFSGNDEFEEEAEHRRVLIWLLSLVRPRVADLVGGPPSRLISPPSIAMRFLHRPSPFTRT